MQVARRPGRLAGLHARVRVALTSQRPPCRSVRLNVSESVTRRSQSTRSLVVRPVRPNSVYASATRSAGGEGKRGWHHRGGWGILGGVTAAGLMLAFVRDDSVDAAEHLKETDYPRVPRHRHSPGALFDYGEVLGAESEPGPMLRGLAERENAPVLDPYTDRRFDFYFKTMEMSLGLIPDLEWRYRTAPFNTWTDPQKILLYQLQHHFEPFAKHLTEGFQVTIETLGDAVPPPGNPYDPTSIMNTQSPEKSQVFGLDRGTAQQYALKLAENRDMEPGNFEELVEALQLPDNLARKRVANIFLFERIAKCQSFEDFMALDLPAEEIARLVDSMKHNDAEFVVEPSSQDMEKVSRHMLLDVETEKLAEKNLAQNQLFGKDDSIDQAADRLQEARLDLVPHVDEYGSFGEEADNVIDSVGAMDGFYFEWDTQIPLRFGPTLDASQINIGGYFELDDDWDPDYAWGASTQWRVGSHQFSASMTRDGEMAGEWAFQLPGWDCRFGYQQGDTQNRDVYEVGGLTAGKNYTASVDLGWKGDIAELEVAYSQLVTPSVSVGMTAKISPLHLYSDFGTGFMYENWNTMETFTAKIHSPDLFDTAILMASYSRKVDHVMTWATRYIWSSEEGEATLETGFSYETDNFFCSAMIDNESEVVGNFSREIKFLARRGISYTAALRWNLEDEFFMYGLSLQLPQVLPGVLGYLDPNGPE